MCVIFELDDDWCSLSRWNDAEEDIIMNGIVCGRQKSTRHRFSEEVGQIFAIDLIS